MPNIDARPTLAIVLQVNDLWVIRIVRCEKMDFEPAEACDKINMGLHGYILVPKEQNLALNKQLFTAMGIEREDKKSRQKYASMQTSQAIR